MAATAAPVAPPSSRTIARLMNAPLAVVDTEYDADAAAATEAPEEQEAAAPEEREVHWMDRPVLESLRTALRGLGHALIGLGASVRAPSVMPTWRGWSATTLNTMMVVALVAVLLFVLTSVSSVLSSWTTLAAIGVASYAVGSRRAQG